MDITNVSNEIEPMIFMKMLMNVGENTSRVVHEITVMASLMT
jgi:hypothetical protein